jgi:hypothetical protein
MAVTNMGFLLVFWTKQNTCPFDVFFYTKVLKFLPAKQALGYCRHGKLETSWWNIYKGINFLFCLHAVLS